MDGAASNSSLHQFVQRRGVRCDVRVDGQIAAGQHHRHAVFADGSGQHDLVAGLDELTCQPSALRDHAHTGGGDVDAVGGALAHDLGVTGDDLHTGAGRRFAHVGDDLAEFGDREALLDDERRRQPLRPRARHGQVVDRAVHRDVPDRTAGKTPRRNDIRVGGERQPLTRGGLQHRGVAELLELVVAERLEEHRVDECRRGLPARTVRERHHVVEQPRPALPELVDAFQHPVFALGGAHRVGGQVRAPFLGRVMCS